ncbi:NADP transhydrogenase subunit beta [Paraburkholderia sp. CNPSo 3157]|uniref:NADP transhydrogenase subunit beta n=1 Tax=Paraburkholderia franconis TaxID=2654983 RepID=A0A7X1NGC7_9BURK|nr:NADP transhydrogenase subunit beta [Paraburkholderia franconis]MPW21031.1 NADP transhydrogenase subunit beta [Paraburkholderia franconis]
MPDCASFIAWSGLERLELYVFVFVGALLFAIAAMMLANRMKHGRRSMRQGAAGDKLVDMLALGLCIWLGYAFVSEPAQMPGIAALFAVSLLAAALGAHVMLTTHEHHARTPAHCGLSSRRGTSLRFAWDGDPSHGQPADDFTQRWTWASNPRRTQARCASSARNMHLTHAAVRVRSRQRYSAKRH